MLGLVAAVPQLGAAVAQPMEAAKLQAFTNSEHYRSLLRSAFTNVSEVVFKRCATLVSNASNIMVVRPVTFGEDGFPNAGLWKQAFPMSGCGNDTVLNFYFVAAGDKKINTIIGVPGTTRADLALQRDALLYANIGAGVVAKGCKSFVVKNAKFEAFGLANPATRDPGPTERLRPWWETWTLAGCDRTIEVPMNFVPDATGTLIHPGGARER